MTTAQNSDILETFGANITAHDIDNRPLPEPEAIETAIACMVEPINSLFDACPLSADLESALWGIVNAFHAQVKRLDRALDDNERAQARLREQHDGSEIIDTQLTDAIENAKALIDRRQALEQMFDAAASEFEAASGSVWQPRYGSRPRTPHLTAAMIDSRDFERARRQKWTEDNLPAGPYVVVSGGQEFQDIDAIWNCLDRVRAKHQSFVLLHGGNKSVDTIASTWADNRGITQIRYGLHKRRPNDRAAAFRRNEKMLGEMPIGVLTFPGSGVTKALIREARNMGIPVMDYEERQQRCGRDASDDHTTVTSSDTTRTANTENAVNADHEHKDEAEPTNEPHESRTDEPSRATVTVATAAHLTTEQLIDAVGTHEIAEHFGLNESTVKGWKVRGMPASRRDAFLAFATT